MSILSHRKLLVATTVMVLALLVGPPAPATPFQNGSFESFTGSQNQDIIPLPTGSTAITNWVVLGAPGEDLPLVAFSVSFGLLLKWRNI